MEKNLSKNVSLIFDFFIIYRLKNEPTSARSAHVSSCIVHAGLNITSLPAKQHAKMVQSHVLSGSRMQPDIQSFFTHTRPKISKKKSSISAEKLLSEVHDAIGIDVHAIEVANVPQKGHPYSHAVAWHHKWF